jgi:hypothetical protein
MPVNTVSLMFAVIGIVVFGKCFISDPIRRMLIVMDKNLDTGMGEMHRKLDEMDNKLEAIRSRSR